MASIDSFQVKPTHRLPPSPLSPLFAALFFFGRLLSLCQFFLPSQPVACHPRPGTEQGLLWINEQFHMDYLYNLYSSCTVPLLSS